MFGNPSLPAVRPFGLRRIRLILNVSPIHFGFRLASRLQSGTLRLGNPGFRTCSRKIQGKYVVLSKISGRRFGAYATRAEAKKRLQQVEFFKRRSKKP